MAALSSKTQRGQLLLVDTFTLTAAEQELCLKEKLRKFAGNIKQVDKYFMPERVLRERYYAAIDGDESLLLDPDGAPLDDEAVMNNVRERLLASKRPIVPLFMNTGAPPQRCVLAGCRACKTRDDELREAAGLTRSWRTCSAPPVITDNLRIHQQCYGLLHKMTVHACSNSPLN